MRAKSFQLSHAVLAFSPSAKRILHCFCTTYALLPLFTLADCALTTGVSQNFPKVDELILTTDTDKPTQPQGHLTGMDMDTSSTGPLPWWKTSIIYQIYPRSFKDSNGDGIGDLKGIISKLDYITNLGAGAIWLSPFYPSPQKDFGYDISDYCDVDPQFGTVGDFDDLIKEAKKRDIKVIVDFVIGHSSDQHDWFKHSTKREGKYKDYYIWSDGKLQADGTRVPPNNWVAVFGGSAWEWNEERQQFYYHAFLKEQPTLNHRNPEVEEEMRQVVRYWMDKGVDGLRVDAVPNMIVTKDLSLDEPPSGVPGVKSDEYLSLKHIYTTSQPEIIPAMERLMNVIKEYETRDGKPRFVVLETYESDEKRNAYYKTGAVPFNLELTGGVGGLTQNITGHYMNKTLMDYYNGLPKGAWPNFAVANHDVWRVTKRYGPQYTDAWNMLLLTLLGTPTHYYGEELGLLSPNITWEQCRDPQGLWYGPKHFSEHTRDYSRGPMQWDATQFAGFTKGKQPWLPVGPSYEKINVKVEEASTRQSSLQLFQQLAQLRQQPAFITGNFGSAVVDENIFSYTRQQASTRYLVAINFGKKASTNSYTQEVGAPKGQLVAHSGLETLRNGDQISLNDVTLKPGEGIIVLLTPGEKNSFVIG